MAMLIYTACDPVHHLASGPHRINADLKRPTALYIKGPSHAFPVLDSITIERAGDGRAKVLLLSATQRPTAELMSELSAVSLDSLAALASFSSVSGRAVYPLAATEFAMGQKKDTLSVRFPITHSDNYIMAITEPPLVGLKLTLKFHRTGNGEVPEVEIVNLK